MIGFGEEHTAFCFRVGSPLMVCVTGSGNELCTEEGGPMRVTSNCFMLLLEPHVLVTFSAFFLSVFYILFPSVKFQMPRAPSVY